MNRKNTQQGLKMIHLPFILLSLLLCFLSTRAAPTTAEINILPSRNFTPLTRLDHVPPSLLAREIPSKMTEVPGRVAYTTPVKIGATTFNLFMDTGSSITWATPAKHTCRTLSNENCAIGTSDSAHLVVTSDELGAGRDFAISYGDKSSATGVWVDRAVSLAGVTLPRQAVGAATEVHALSPNNARQIDGLLGLGPGLERGEYAAPFFNAIQNRGISAPQFSIALFGNAAGKDDPSKRDGGLLAFGGYPDSLELTSKWAMAPLITGDKYGGWYTINVDGYVLSGKRLSSGGLPMIVDSGTTVTTLPPAVANEVFKALPGQGSDPTRPCAPGMDDRQKCLTTEKTWKIPCEEKVPAFSVVVGGMEFVFQADNMKMLRWENHCEAGVKPAPEGENKGTLGFSFMKNDVVVLHDYTDRTKPRILMATYKDKEN